MYKILVIDDNKTLAELNFRPEKPKVTYARTVKEGINLLKTDHWDELHLDWSLDPGCGSEVLDWLADHVHYVPKKIIPCTDNFLRAKEITQKAEALQAMNRQFYKKNFLAEHFVGNTSPTVFQKSPDALYVSPVSYDEEESCVDKALGSICTDLWWYCAVDKGEFEKRIGKTTTQWEEEYHKTGAWPKLITAKVTPGKYRFTDRYHLCNDTDKIFSTIERVGDCG